MMANSVVRHTFTNVDEPDCLDRHYSERQPFSVLIVLLPAEEEPWNMAKKFDMEPSKSTDLLKSGTKRHHDFCAADGRLPS